VLWSGSPPPHALLADAGMRIRSEDSGRAQPTGDRGPKCGTPEPPGNPLRGNRKFRDVLDDDAGSDRIGHDTVPLCPFVQGFQCRALGGL